MEEGSGSFMDRLNGFCVATRKKKIGVCPHETDAGRRRAGAGGGARH